MKNKSLKKIKNRFWLSTISAIIFDDCFRLPSRWLLHLVNGITDIQVLPLEVSRCIQKEEEPQEGQMDQSLQEDRWQRIGSGPIVRIWEEKERTRQI